MPSSLPCRNCFRRGVLPRPSRATLSWLYGRRPLRCSSARREKHDTRRCSVRRPLRLVSSHNINRSLLILHLEYSSTGDGRFWESYQCIDQALACFRDSLPPVDATMFSQSSVIDNESAGVHATTIMAASNNLLPQRQDWLEFTLTFAHVSAAAAVIQLHGIFSDRDESETSVVLAAARDIAGIIRTIGTRGSELNQSSVLPSFDPRRHHKLVYVRLLSFPPFFVRVEYLTQRYSMAS